VFSVEKNKKSKIFPLESKDSNKKHIDVKFAISSQWLSPAANVY